MITKKKLKEILAIEEWVEEEAPVSFFLLDHFKTCYLDSIYAHKKKFYQTVVYLVDNKYAYEWTPKEDSQKILDWLLKNQKRNPRFLNTKDTYFSEVYKETRTFSDALQKIDLKKVSTSELLRMYKTASALSKKQYGYSLITEAGDVLEESDYANALKGISEKQIPNIVRTLSVPAKRTFLDDYAIALNDAALRLKKVYKRIPKKIKGVSDELLLKKIHKIRNSYYWIDNSFKIAKSLTQQEIYKKIAEKAIKYHPNELRTEIRKLLKKPQRIRKEQKTIRSRYSIPQEGKRLFTVLRYLVWLQDRRKELVLRFGSNLSRVFNEVSRRTKIPRSEIEFYLIEDIHQLLRRGTRVSRKEIQRRNKTISVGYYKGSETAAQFFMGKDVDPIYAQFRKKREQLHNKTIKGFVASYGNNGPRVKGKVRKIFDPAHGSIKKGEILVTGMTRTEFVPLMKKAKAVITNEGGITTHAAIVSRELGIPCIIGTKYATDVLKNGDIIQMDMKKGMIAKI